jgi:hypothetical protein
VEEIMTDQNDYLKQPLDVRVSTVGTNSTDIEMKRKELREEFEKQAKEPYGTEGHYDDLHWWIEDKLLTCREELSQLRVKYMEYAKEVEKERDNLKALVGELVECILNDGARVYPKTILNSLITTAESMIGGKT